MRHFIPGIVLAILITRISEVGRYITMMIFVFSDAYYIFWVRFPIFCIIFALSFLSLPSNHFH